MLVSFLLLISKFRPFLLSLIFTLRPPMKNRAHRVQIITFLIIGISTGCSSNKALELQLSQAENMMQSLPDSALRTRQHDFDIMITSGRTRPARPRMILPTPVNCSYDAQSESLNFMFSEDLGGITITVLNTTKGTVIYDMCSSTPGS